MLRPSYTELMNLLNDSNDVDSKITSRYTIVIAVAKRARQLIDGQEAMAKTTTDKAVSIAVEEMYEGKLRIINSEPEDEQYAAMPGEGPQNLILVDNLDDL